MKKEVVNRIMLFLVFVVILFGLTGCAKQYVCGDGSVVSDVNLCPKVKEAQEGSDKVEEMAKELEKVGDAVIEETVEIKTVEETLSETNKIIQEPEKKMTSKVSELLSKYEKVKSYSYFQDSGTYNGFEVWIKGNKIKKKYAADYYKPDERMDVVFIDRDEKTAYGYCYVAKADSDCVDERMGKAFKMSFDDENIVAPIDLVKKIKYAKFINDEMLESRTLAVIKTDDDHKYWVEQYYGIPMKQQKVKSVDDQEEVLEEHTFTEMKFNSVSAEEVTLPSDAMMDD